MNEIREALNRLVSSSLNGVELYSVVGTVSNIDENKRTCDVTPIEGALIPDVRLTPTPTVGNGFILIPKGGTKVVVSFASDTLAFIYQVDELDKIIINVGSSQLIITDGLFEFNDGDNDGLININDLVTKLNNLENKVNELVINTSTHVHSGVTTGVGTSAVSTTPVVGQLTPTVKPDIEDDKIKH